jgi:hypothetical protein
LISTISPTPFLAQSSNSEAFMRREAVATSGVLEPTPLQNSLMPPPVPSASTRGAGRPDFCWKFSDTRAAKGATVDEPAAHMARPLPDPPELWEPSPQPARRARAGRRRTSLFMLTCGVRLKES